MRLGASRWAAVGPAAVAVPALALRIPALTGGQIDYDEGVYWQSLRALAAGHSLFGEVYSSQPPGFLILVFPFYWVLGHSLVGARCAVLVTFLAGLLAGYRTVSLLVGRAAGLVAASVLAADPILFRESVALQADCPSIGIGLVALALGVEARCRRGRARNLLTGGAGAALALAFLVKPLAAAAGPALAIALVTPGLSGREVLRGLGVALAGGLAAAAALLLPFASHWRELWDQSVGLHLMARHSELGGLDNYTVVYELPILVLGTAGLLVALRAAPHLAASVGAGAAAAALVLALQRPLWPHHLVALVAPLALLSGALVAWIPERPRPAITATLAGLLLVATYASAAHVGQQQLSDDRLRPAVARLQTATRPGDLIVTDDQYLVALANRDTPPSLVDTSLVRVNSGELTPTRLASLADQAGARAVLLTGGRLSEMPEVEEWARAHYPRREQLSRREVLYWRESPP